MNYFTCQWCKAIYRDRYEHRRCEERCGNPPQPPRYYPELWAAADAIDRDLQTLKARQDLVALLEELS